MAGLFGISSLWSIVVRMKYVSPEYQAQLDHLAETLCTPERFGKVALENELQLDLAIPENIVVGVE